MSGHFHQAIVMKKVLRNVVNSTADVNLYAHLKTTKTWISERKTEDGCKKVITITGDKYLLKLAQGATNLTA